VSSKMHVCVRVRKDSPRETLIDNGIFSLEDQSERSHTQLIISSNIKCRL
jgi:hypothetical protein